MALRFNTGTITHFDDKGDRLLVTGVARHAGILKYRSDSGERYEFVPPSFNAALDSNGFPYIGQLGGAIATREHPPCLISHDADLRERYQVGEVQPQVKVYKDGKVEVTVEVYDAATIDDIKSGRKRGFSCGYQTNVVQQDGEWNGQRYTHVQSEPVKFDHLAIVGHPRAPEALITRVDSDTRHADGFEVAWSADSFEENSMSALSLDRLDGAMDSAIAPALQALLSHMDKGGTGPCGKGWVGTKPNCKRPPKGANTKSGASKVKAESESLSKLGKKSSPSDRLKYLREKAAIRNMAAKPKTKQERAQWGDEYKNTPKYASEKKLAPNNSLVDKAIKNATTTRKAAKKALGEKLAKDLNTPGKKSAAKKSIKELTSGDIERKKAEFVRQGVNKPPTSTKKSTSTRKKASLSPEESANFEATRKTVQAATKPQRQKAAAAQRKIGLQQSAAQSMAANKAARTRKKKSDSLNLDSNMNLIQLLSRMDKKTATGPCGNGWVGTKPNCKRAPKGANSKSGATKVKAESAGLKKLGQSSNNTARQARLNQLKSNQSQKSVDKSLAAFGVGSTAKKSSAASSSASKAASTKKAQKDVENLLGSFGVSPTQNAIAKAKSSSAAKKTKKSVKSSLSALGLGGVAVDSAETLNLDALIMPETLHPVTYQGQTYHLDSDDYATLLDALNLDMDEEEDPEEVEPDSDRDDADAEMEEEDEEESELPPAFLKNMKKMKAKKGQKADSADLQARIDELEGQLAIATRLLMDADEEDADEEELMDSLEQAVQSRLDELFAAFDDARDYLPAEFKLDGSMTGADVKLAAIANFDSTIADRLDSAEAVEGAYTILKQHQRRDGVEMLKTAVDAANGGSVPPTTATRKDGGMRPLTYRKRS